MRIFSIVPLIDGKIAKNKEGDKRIRKLLDDNFNNKKVMLLPRSKSQKHLVDLYAHKIIFLEDSDVSFLQLTISKQEFTLQEIKDFQTF